MLAIAQLVNSTVPQQAMLDRGCRAETEDLTPPNPTMPSILPFSMISQPMLVKMKRQVWLPSTPINVRISNYMHTTGNILNPNLYTINFEHGQYKWITRKRYKDFQALHASLKLHSAKQHLLMRARNLDVPHLPSFLDTYLTPKQMPKIMRDLEYYLQKVLSSFELRNHLDTLEFCEVSVLSFKPGYGEKGLEELGKKRSGGYYGLKALNWFKKIFLRWRKRWFILKDSYLVYIHPRKKMISSVMLVDSFFSAHIQEKGSGNRLVVQNRSRKILVKFPDKYIAQEWLETIKTGMPCSTAILMTNHRFKSFAPARPDSHGFWFVDGASYFSAVADALYSAKEEIFITDWWLSPQYYLKRPLGDDCERWRLDHILRKKAEDGVKIYIMIYKEVALALGINSYYSKNALKHLHPYNIIVLRHPDHIKSQVYMWAHHEKLVCIDQQIAFVGGLDICYARWDDYQHRLTDLGTEGDMATRPNYYTANDMSGVLDLINPKAILQERKFIPSPKSTARKIVDRVRLKGMVGKIKGAGGGGVGPGPADSYPLAELSGDEEVIPHPLPYGMVEVHGGSGSARERSQLDPKVSNAPSSTLKIPQSKLRPASMPHTEGFTVDGLENKAFQDDKFTPKHSNGKAHSLADTAVHMISSRNQGTDPNVTVPVGKHYHPHIEKLRFKIRKHMAELSDGNQERRAEKVRRAYEDLMDKGGARTTAKEAEVQKREDDKYYGVSDLKLNVDLIGSGKYWIGKDYSNFIYKDFAHVDLPYTDLIDRHTIPRMPWHDIGSVVYGASARDVARHFIERWNFTVVEKYKDDPYTPLLLPKTYANLQVPKEIADRAFNCEIQICRSCTTWSAGIKDTEDSIHRAYQELIMKAKHYIYIENQFFVSVYNNSIVQNKISEALYDRVALAIKNEEKFRVYIMTPLLPGFEGQIGGQTGACIQTIIHWNNCSMALGDNSLLGRLKKLVDDPFEYVTFCSLRNYAELEENLVTELIYIHSKLMIVDDEWALIGSANINDRSMLGYRDSELAVVFHDTQFFEGRMNGNKTSVGVFAGSLRRRLFREHLTILDKDSKIDFTDPICDEFYQMWNDVARQNTLIYEEVFRCIPTNRARNFASLAEFQKETPLARSDPEAARIRVKKIQGHLVHMPLHFLCNETRLLPQILSKEGLAPSSVFT